jgi:hypothetical protein
MGFELCTDVILTCDISTVMLTMQATIESKDALLVGCSGSGGRVLALVQKMN